MSDQLISVEVFCTHQGVEASFVHALCERGLIRLTVLDHGAFVETSLLPHIEKLARMHYDMDIDLAGIEAISHLLERMQRLQEEVVALRDRLGLYESPDLAS